MWSQSIRFSNQVSHCDFPCELMSPFISVRRVNVTPSPRKVGFSTHSINGVRSPSSARWVMETPPPEERQVNVAFWTRWVIVTFPVIWWPPFLPVRRVNVTPSLRKCGLSTHSMNGARSPSSSRRVIVTPSLRKGRSLWPFNQVSHCDSPCVLMTPFYLSKESWCDSLTELRWVIYSFHKWSEIYLFSGRWVMVTPFLKKGPGSHRDFPWIWLPPLSHWGESVWLPPRVKGGHGPIP